MGCPAFVETEGNPGTRWPGANTPNRNTVSEIPTRSQKSAAFGPSRAKVSASRGAGDPTMPVRERSRIDPNTMSFPDGFGSSRTGSRLPTPSPGAGPGWGRCWSHRDHWGNHPLLSCCGHRFDAGGPRLTTFVDAGSCLRPSACDKTGRAVSRTGTRGPGDLRVSKS